MMEQTARYLIQSYETHLMNHILSAMTNYTQIIKGFLTGYETLCCGGKDL